MNAYVGTLSNCPATSAFVMYVYYATGQKPDGEYNYINQEITAYLGGNKFLRTFNIGPTSSGNWKTYKYSFTEVS